MVGDGVDTKVLGGVVQSSSPDYSGVHPAITIRPWDSKQSKTRTVIAHSACLSRDYVSHNNSLVNLLRALNERVYYVEGKEGLVECPKAQTGAWRRMDWLSYRLAEDVVREHPSVRRLTCEEFVSQCPAHKRKLYTQAAEKYVRHGVHKRDAKLGSFVKFEKIEAKPNRPDPCPRIIQPRSPVYNVALGRYTRAVEEDLFISVQHVWATEMRSVGPIVMKGLTVNGVAMALWRKWVRFARPVAVGLDAKRFDQHVGVDALKWEHSVYNRIFRSKELVRLLKMQLKNFGSAFMDGFRVDYEVDGTRSSGDMNTGLGNCLIMSMLVLLYCKEKGITADLVNNGDDCVVIMEVGELDRFMCGLDSWFLSFGFEMEVEKPVHEFELIEFCQMQPVSVGFDWVMVRNPFAALSKDTMCLGLPSSQYKMWVHMVGMAGMSLYADVPIFNRLYSRMCKGGKPSRIRNQPFMETGFLRLKRDGVESAVHDSTRISFYRAFGISPTLQRCVESELDRLEFTGFQRVVGPLMGVSRILHSDRGGYL